MHRGCGPDFTAPKARDCQDRFYPGQHSPAEERILSALALLYVLNHSPLLLAFLYVEQLSVASFYMV